MQIIEIEEPDSVDKQQAEELIVGIDFGTTNSLIAISKDSEVQFFKTASGTDLLPSIICTDSRLGKWVVGTKLEKLGCVKSIKRLLAKSYDEIMSNTVLSTLVEYGSFIESNNKAQIVFANVPEKNHSIPLVASEIFQSLRKSALEQMALAGDTSLKAVVSVPAYFSDAERGQVMLAAKYAGIEVLRLIPEPTAAAYAYGLQNGLQKGAKGTYLVYDFGGGTFDVSLLDMSGGVLQVIACGGDNNLGGDDIDFAIAKYLTSRYKKVGQGESLEISSQLVAKSKKLKEELSEKYQSSIDINGQEYVISKEDINPVIAVLIDKTIKIAGGIYFDADEPNLDGIILVGGTTRIPLIQEKLQQRFSAKIYNSMDPDRAVACGAAMQAENLATNKGNLLIDVVPLSVGLELYGGLFEKIILRNTPMPFSISREFTTQADFQTGMNFHVLQGEREMASDCRSLAHFELKGLPSKKAGMVKVIVRFAMDADGILSVTASEADSGRAINIVCRPGYGLTEQQVTEDLDQAYANAGEDHQQRLMTETCIEARELINGLRVALVQTPDIISNVEYDEINARIDDLEKAVDNVVTNGPSGIEIRDNILGKMQELNNSATKFIEKHLNIGADKIIVGKNIRDLEE